MMKEIKFKRDTSFRKQFFVPDSFAHPAKMDAQLLIWIVEKFTQPGEVILDPMAGSGTTMLACTLGRHCVLIELEEKFCKMMRDNWNEVRMRPQLGSQMGDCQIIQGDARQLEGLVDKVITSPPYAGAEQFLDKEWINREQPRPHRPQVDKIVTSPPFGGAEASDDRKTFNPTHQSIGQGSLKTHHYDKGNLANLPYGNIDSIITSPPYEGSLQGEPTEEQAKRHAQYLDDADVKRGRRKGGRFTPGRLKHFRIMGRGYTDSVDSIITSPPYEGTTGEGKEIGSEGHTVGPFHYGNDSRQIGNLKSQSYLEAMLIVYQQCYKVLKDGGLMILVTKNFIRNKQVIRLDLDTISLCQQAGFSYMDRYYRKLPAQSFWRIIYYKKHPEVERINHEDVLIFRRV